MPSLRAERSEAWQSTKINTFWIAASRHGPSGLAAKGQDVGLLAMTILKIIFVAKYPDLGQDGNKILRRINMLKNISCFGGLPCYNGERRCELNLGVEFYESLSLGGTLSL